ncbi:MAG: PD40 domain-containing protein [Anaerolineales bacterium]|nr:PD40 domain-containing protein [Anaerolineales bacterium]
MSRKSIVLFSLGAALVSFLIFGLALAQDQAPVKAPQATIDPTSNYVIIQKWDQVDSTIWAFNGITQTFIITGYSPRLSHDGHYLAYKKGGSNKWNSDLYVRDLQDETEIMIFDNSDHIGYYSWSADDSRLYFDYSCDMYTIKPDGTDEQKIIDDWPSSYYSCWNDWPDINPIDGRIVWENENYGLGIANGDGSDPAWIPNTEPYDYDARWSHDGQWIVFYRADNAHKIKPDGTNLTQLTQLLPDDNNWVDWVGGWMTDGQYLVGAMKVNGVYGIYAYPSNGSGLLCPLLLEDGIDEYFIGDVVGQIPFNQLFLPLVVRNTP